MNPHPYAIEQLVRHRQEAILREAALARLVVQTPFRVRLAVALIALARHLAPTTPSPALVATVTSHTGKL